MKYLARSLMLLSTAFTAEPSDYKGVLQNMVGVVNQFLKPYIDNLQNNNPIPSFPTTAYVTTSSYSVFYKSSSPTYSATRMKIVFSGNTWGSLDGTQFLVIPSFTSSMAYLGCTIYTDLDQRLTPYIGYVPVGTNGTSGPYKSYISYNYKDVLSYPIQDVFFAPSTTLTGWSTSISYTL